MADAATAAWVIWRHPRPEGAAGRCIGRTDLRVDRRKAKRLAHRIRQRARCEAWPAVVWTSPLQRCADVGRWLARWGWQHRLDARLFEVDFGAWDGLTWQAIGAGPVAAWCDEFTDHAPGGGESVRALMRRCAGFLADVAGTQNCAQAPVLIVGHAGWINAARWQGQGRQPPFDAAQWPAALGYGQWVSGAADAVSSSDPSP